ncbi:MAG TPA: hypothetical protein VG755_17990, partial [Nannocystaceae bacterium]|nr:hypothetical protein [Nannocystaceae bacterium]
MKLASRLSLALFALACASACRNQNTVVVPNRVLDRPLDMTLACVEKSDDRIVVRALNDCVDQPLGHCLDEDTPQLIGFIANSEKNEVGMFRRCDTNGMVDLDPEAPGYNLVPVGTTPSRIVQTPDCRVVTANYGSCDLSAIEMPDLAAYAVGLPPDEAPSSLVSTIVPRRSDGTPLGARPGDMIAVPRELSLADDGDVSFGDTGTDESGGAESSGGDTNTVETDGADGFIGGACDPEASASVYVTFPQCQLVAEISLDTQRVLQSRQFVLDDNGEITIVDSGPDPVCPIECPAQFDGDIPDIAAPPDGGVFPIALALVEGEEGADSHHFELPSLFVGGSDSDEIF